jgi:hypothetical protein
MSEVLREAPFFTSDDLPETIELELCVKDRDVVTSLLEHAEGIEREEYALEALKIGVLALRRATSALDRDALQREMTQMLESLQERLNAHAELAKTRFDNTLQSYFDPESGHFSQRVSELISDNGRLAKLLRDSFDGDKSQLAQTMVSHVGQHSPLMRYLSPQQSDGLLAVLKANVEAQLEARQVRILSEFSLDNPTGALSQMIERLTAKHGGLSQALQDKIDAMTREFSLDEENSSLTRLMKRVEGAQDTITGEFSLDNDQSALCKLKSELITILQAQVEANADFQEEVKVSLAKLVTRRETEARSTQHGGTFEAAVFEFIDRDAQRRGDVAEKTGNTPGLIRNRKFGDVVLHLGRDCIAAGAKIVIEAKEVAGYSLKAAQDEIEQARKNRDAQLGVFVFSRRTAPPLDAPLARWGDDVFVVWDAEDSLTDGNMIAALEIARALCVRCRLSAERKQIDFTQIDRAINSIEKQAQSLDQIRASAQTILDHVKNDRKVIEDQVAVLRREMTSVKAAWGEADGDEATNMLATPAPSN